MAEHTIDSFETEEHIDETSTAAAAEAHLEHAHADIADEHELTAHERLQQALAGSDATCGSTSPSRRTSSETHSSTNDEVDYEQEADMGEDDDVFSNRSQRTSMGSFEHNSGASNTGSDYDNHKKDDTEQSMADVADAHHSEARSSRTSKGPRISDVTGISNMSQYDGHEHDDDERYHDGNNYTPHTIRGAPRPAFRSPSSVRAMQMSSPSPSSAVFGVSPRSAARRRRLGTGEGVDAGQSMGSNATYSSLPNSPSKRNTPSRLKTVHRPEPAPLVLLHATIMPTRWGWSDVLRSFDEMGSHAHHARLSSDNQNEHDLVDDIPTDLSAFKPSAALKRLHHTWCQLQEYSLGADTVTERGVLLPHPQNDFEVLEERLLEALELPVRHRARILECGHYLGPASVDADDDEDYDDYDDEHDGDGDSANKRHWCTFCRSDIRYESLSAERVFRVKVYASNGLMTVGAWDACWREMERVDVEIEPIVADAALQRELNLLRTLQQQEAYQREVEEEARAMHEEEEEEDDHEEHNDATFAAGDSHIESPATATDHDYRKRAAEDRLREIYGNVSPQSAPRTASLPPQMEPIPGMAATSGTAMTMASHSTHNQHSTYGPWSPPSHAEAHERPEERHHRQYSYPDHGPADRGFEYGAPPPAYPPQPASHNGNYNHGHPQPPYESASLPELLMAAVKVFLRDRKHVAITVLSVIVIVLATLRAPTISVDATTAAPIINTSALPKSAVYQPVDEAHEAPAVAITTATVFQTVVEEMAAIDTEVATVVEKMTVKVYETVTEVATETATETATTATTEAVTAIESTPAEEAANAEAETVSTETEESIATETETVSTEAVSTNSEESVMTEAEAVSTETEESVATETETTVEEPQMTAEPEIASSVAAELPEESAVVEDQSLTDEDEVHDDHDEL